MIRGLVSILLVCLTSASLSRQPLSVDVVTFKAESGNTLVEVFLKLSTDSLGTISTPEGKRIVVAFSVTVEDSSGVAQLSDRWERQLTEPPRADHEGQVYFIDSSTLELPPGQYTLLVSAEDRATHRVHQVRKTRLVPSYNAPGLQVSDILLSGTITKADTEGQFVRSGYKITPNPDRIFGARSRTFFVYQEIYHLSSGAGLQDSLSVSYRLKDEFGREVRSYAPSGGRRTGDTMVNVAGLSIAGLSPGRYVLEIGVQDKRSGLRTSSRIGFEVVPPRSLQIEEELSMEDIQKSLDLLLHLASSRERSLLESLDEQGKKNFVRRFWMDRDTDHSTPGNPYRVEMIRRYDYASEHFSGHSPGWLSDRGRVYIIYGPPREIQRNVSNPGTRDYEIWIYALEGETEFVFVDEHGYGEYRLVHSNARGEIENPQWEQLVRQISRDR